MTLDEDINSIHDDWSRKLISTELHQIYSDGLSALMIKNWITLNKSKGESYPTIEKMINERYSILGRVKALLHYNEETPTRI